MIQRREELRLALEARDPFRIVGETLRQEFDRDIARKPRVARFVDFAHAAGAERRDDFVRTEATARLKRHVESRRIIRRPGSATKTRSHEARSCTRRFFVSSRLRG